MSKKQLHQLRIALIIGIILIAASGNNGWGWLVFILIAITLN